MTIEIKDLLDRLPDVADYRRYLQIASHRFGLTINECRDMFGRYTGRQWAALLNQQYVITQNIEDRPGYQGQPLSIAKVLAENYYELADTDGNLFFAGEEEISPYNETAGKRID